MAERIGLGTVVAMEGSTPGVFTKLGVLKEFSGTETTLETADVTNFDDVTGFRRFIGTMLDGGEITFMMEYDPNLSVHATLDIVQRTRGTKKFKFSYAGLTVNTVVEALVTSLGREFPIENVMAINVSLKVTGAPTESLT